MRVQGTGSGQVLTLRMVSRVQPPGDATVRRTCMSVNRLSPLHDEYHLNCALRPE
jgi:hypothetical protein